LREPEKKNELPQLNMNKAIFLDKDGTLIPDIPYNVDPEQITLSNECIEGLKALLNDGYQLVVVSNQPGIAMGYFTEEQLALVVSWMYELLSKQGVVLTDFYYCPHHPDGTECECRKPMPGMLLKAAAEHQLDLSKSWMIGDILNDVEAGARAGCRTILIDNGNETEWLDGPCRTPSYQCETINQAAVFIHNHDMLNVRLEQR
jgi:D-glycero-D-manno-heptose 1,7-bisphosphate phosphatase